MKIAMAARAGQEFIKVKPIKQHRGDATKGLHGGILIDEVIASRVLGRLGRVIAIEDVMKKRCGVGVDYYFLTVGH